LKEIWQQIFPSCPKEYRDEFKREVLKGNFDRLAVLSIVAFVIESALFFFEKSLFHTGAEILSFLGISIILIPAIWYVKQNASRINFIFAKTVQLSYCLACLIFGIALALSDQAKTDLTYVYVLVVFAVTTVVYARPLERGILLFSVFLGFSVLLPDAQTNHEIIAVTRINTLVLNIIAWFQGNLIVRMKLSSFLSEKHLYEKNRILEGLIQKDSMTGLLNHKAVFQRLSEEINHSQRMEHPLSIIVLDIDNFKQINDRYGHLTGDKVILGVAKAIVGVIRKTDCAGRYGGDEFMIVLPNTDMDAAKSLSQRITKAMDTMRFDDNLKVSLSGGISQYRGGSEKELIQMADICLYQAKNLGKNHFEVSEEAHPESQWRQNSDSYGKVSAL
jgi:diguanylate cyclase (GGDEF)-like protein